LANTKNFYIDKKVKTNNESIVVNQFIVVYFAVFRCFAVFPCFRTYSAHIFVFPAAQYAGAQGKKQISRYNYYCRQNHNIHTYSIDKKQGFNRFLKKS
jgi:hypothetical protein